ncbi:hypothetical protein B0I72DRAFT_143035 [Yarrowia lipolytica]|jgi:tetratricopeptide (TPR) repeat protein|uniref:YALI0C10428p n=2 Tax=Yarrowia lipolytica TaxID=4952 RepID=Q6CCD4_YARLI|nr:YALI0C10428p [Yarrowia lipolytica CLIB122]AOW02638.1 hypothetical protein YALI1_C14709g [Yarrowia lipolytica]KAB8279995.1 hypothetical protein BKA91DRAFT_142690 [Yarrowia lipolytica]KAE8172446.1 hypothetical protein BKA90DRAFT_137234 [Yarrowia lipolytica]KAJ8053297.1 hypothetical protein LXG23DRAFT_23772 [Yarrowia lipolytica]QNP97340.1 Hypothetical protein YALI2_C00993g [Yarrowia lipolytica]|eukprot:XP_501678.1 YALI0C10428p [Yarrowia lipolytica CLIB122]
MSFNISKILAPGQLEKLVPFDPPEPFNVTEADRELSIDELVDKRLFQLAAEKVALQLTQMGTDMKSTAVDLETAQTVFGLWETRLTCLVLANFHRVAHSEAKSLGDLNVDLYRLIPEKGPSTTPAKPEISIHWDRESIVPWSLRVLTVRLASGSDTHGAILKYHSLAREAKIMRHKKDDTQLWAQRLVELGIYVTAVLVGMGDYANAISHVSSMVGTDSSVPLEAHYSYLRYLLCILCLQTGNFDKAKGVLDTIQKQEGDRNDAVVATLMAICSLASDNVADANSTLESANSSNPLVQNTEAIAAFSTGDTDGAIVQFQSLLEKHAEQMSPAALSASIFNVCSLYETRVDGAVLKKALMEKLSKAGLVGIDVTAFKL